jgi:DNA helicase-2/ATP-dependent DNA helicase PcrA
LSRGTLVSISARVAKEGRIHGGAACEPELEWRVDAPSAKALKRERFVVFSFAELRISLIEPARASTRPPSLANPAAVFLAELDRHARVAVTGVPTQTSGDLHDVYGYLVEPAWRRGVHLRVYADRPLELLRPDELVESEFGYAWTLERLQYIASRAARAPREATLPPLTPIEYRLLQAMRNAGLSPSCQFEVARRFRVDFAFPAAQLAVEADGRAWHDPLRDQRRDRELERLGWSVLRFTGSEIVRDSAACAQVIAHRCAHLASKRRYSSVSTTQAESSWLGRLWAWVVSLVRPAPAAIDDPHLPVADASAVATNESPWCRELDGSQLAAVRSHDGVVQVLAPAGSGKTRVLIARVQELISRGVPANRILCCTFNKEAVAELRRRLREEGVEDVAARSFHGIGWAILNEQRLLRTTVGRLSYPQWRYLAKKAKEAVEGGHGVWIDADVAAEAISRFKLVDLVTPQEARRSLAANPQATPLEQTAVELYRLYEQLLERNEMLDFDDLIMRALQLLMTKRTVRRDWQRKYFCLLVDEYQDIEPAQERLVQMLAAPHDSLFCVGDEDQCIYAWRRAQVERLLLLDRHYPGLERHALEVNYRSPLQLTHASRLLIEHNKRRFPKTIRACDTAQPGQVEITACGPHANPHAHTAQLLHDCQPATTVVLARTRQLLRDVAVECARHGVAFKAGDFILDRAGPHRTLAAYLRLFADPSSARVEDVARVFRIPNRYLPEHAVTELASRLQTGFGFAQAASGLGGEPWRQRELDQAGVLFTRLAQLSNAQELIAALRSEGGLDAYYTAEQKLQQTDRSSVDALDTAEQRAAGLTVSAYADQYAEEAELIRTHRRDTGVELTTIHGAKGREWDRVILVGADDDTLPHRKSLDDTQGDEAYEAALEDERRLAYVALTRAKQQLTIVHQGTESRFLREATSGLEHAGRTRLGFDSATKPQAA